MVTHSHFDYIIIGNGLAGFQLALKLASDPYFNNKQIALIDPSEKNTNDKTWSFWETESSQWNSILYKSWPKASVISSKKKIDLILHPYTYKTIRALDFYKNAQSRLQQKDNFKFIYERVTSVIDDKNVTVITDKQRYTAMHIFDSRVPEAYTNTSNTSINVIQHFKGWVIKTTAETFDDTTVTMMDYRLKDGNQTTFTYVLPFSSTEALIEFTYFTKHTVAEGVYDDFIKQYIATILNVENYTIIETETGQIPMTTFLFEKFNTKTITKIGTGGGWVKGSTGYAFKHTEKKVSKIVKNLKTNNVPSKGLFKAKYKFYDKVFLKVLSDENYKGEWIFEQFYDKNSVQTMFRFLDEDSSFREELKIMASLFSWSFIKAFFKTL